MTAALVAVPDVPEGRCPLHRAYDADYCPVCGTARPVGMTTAEAIAWAARA